MSQFLVEIQFYFEEFRLMECNVLMKVNRFIGGTPHLHLQWSKCNPSEKGE